MKTGASDVLIGAAAGIAATVPMTFTMEGLHAAGGDNDAAPLPPRQVAEGLYAQLGVRDDAGEEEMQNATLLLHYAFGGAAGALFPLVAPKRFGAAIGAGVLYGTAVWAGSYLGILPALDVRNHVKHDPAGRTATMIAAHLVWGGTLALLVWGRPGARTASGHPGAQNR